MGSLLLHLLSLLVLLIAVLPFGCCLPDCEAPEQLEGSKLSQKALRQRT